MELLKKKHGWALLIRAWALNRDNTVQDANKMQSLQIYNIMMSNLFLYRILKKQRKKPQIEMNILSQTKIGQKNIDAGLKLQGVGRMLLTQLI